MKFLHKMFNVRNYLKIEIRGVIFFCNLTMFTCTHKLTTLLRSPVLTQIEMLIFSILACFEY